jgi:tRNA-2-methylthio-N6-dimethylallyladenosine synthase
MKRGYTWESYRDNIAAAKELIPNLAFSSDFITGFPGETDEDFEATLNAVKEMRYESIFSFGYSPRPGTKAAELADDVPLELKSERLARLISTQEEISAEHYNALVGTKLSVLVEGPSKRDENAYTGRTLQNRIMNFIADTPPTVGTEVEVTLTEVKRNSLFGKIEFR